MMTQTYLKLIKNSIKTVYFYIVFVRLFNFNFSYLLAYKLNMYNKTTSNLIKIYTFIKFKSF